MSVSPAQWHQTNDKLILISYFLAPEPQGQQNTATIKNAENLVAAADIS